MSGSKTLEELPQSVRSLSKATLEAMETFATSANQAEAELKFKEYQIKWSNQVQGVMSGFFANYVKSLAGRKLELINFVKRIWGENLADLAEDFLQKQIYYTSPYLTVKVIDKILDKDWSKLKMEFSINGQSVNAEEKILIDGETDEFKISIIKKKDSSVFGVATIPIKDITGSEPLEWPVLKSNGSKQGTLILSIQIHNLGNTSPAEAFSTWIQETLHQQLWKNMIGAENEIKPLELKVKCFVEVKRKSSSPNVSTNIEYQGKVLQQQLLVIPLKDLLADEIVVSSKSDTRPSFLASPRTLGLHKSGVVTLDLNSVSETESEIIRIPLASIPWDGRFCTIKQNDTEWQVRLYGEVPHESFDLYAHYHCLLRNELSTLTEGERMSWNGELSNDLQGIHAFLQPFFPPGLWQREKVKVLLDIHQMLEFNNEVVKQALLESKDLDQNWKAYLEYCIRKLFQKNTSASSPDVVEVAQYVIICQNLNFLISMKDLDSKEIQVIISGIFSQQLACRSENDTSSILDYLLGTVKPSLRLFQSIRERHGADTNEQNGILVESLLQEVLPFMQLPMDNEDLKKAYNVYSCLLDLASAGSMNADKIYKVTNDLVCS